MKELGEAINQSISDSDEIAEVISRIKAGGYDVFLVLEATIGFNQREQEEEPALANRKSPPQFRAHRSGCEVPEVSAHQRGRRKLAAAAERSSHVRGHVKIPLLSRGLLLIAVNRSTMLPLALVGL